MKPTVVEYLANLADNDLYRVYRKFDLFWRFQQRVVVQHLTL